MMDGAGRMPGKVVAVGKKTESSMRKALNDLEEHYDTKELEALMVLLGERLLTNKDEQQKV